MYRTMLLLLALGIVSWTAASRAGGEDPAKGEQQVRADLSRMQGLWRFEAQEEDGKPASVRSLRRKTIFFGGASAVVKDANEVVQASQIILDPKERGALDLKVLVGPFRNITMLGIYEMKGDTLRVCYDTAGRERPREFKTSADSGLVMAVYKRDRAPDDPDISGNYDCAGTEMDGNRYSAKVEIQRLGDAYSVTWAKSGGLMAIGVGLRKGNTLSISFANKGMAGVAVYQIQKDRKLEGEWTEVGGIGVLRNETLTPTK